ncbi:MAG: type IV secretion system DNA-binding domain-containing protein [Patescibacteria group bacterium]|nr:type IV secretion system DNA-binding domain-containing protein [Patescibacteria group bacterium]
MIFSTFSAFQMGLTTQTGGGLDFSSIFSSAYVGGAFWLIVFIVLVSLAAYFIRRSLHLKLKFKRSNEKIVLRVKVPKEVRREDVEQQKSLQQMQELIGFTETIFQTVGSLRGDRGIKEWLTGREDVLTFEMVVNKSLIMFYVTCPVKHRQFIESQIQAQYPHASVEDLGDYNIFSPKGVALGAYLTFKKPNYFPIKTYEKMESDPMNTITNALSKMSDEDGAAIQFVVKSAYAKWRQEGLRIARAMQQGKRYSEVSGGGFTKILKEIGEGIRGSKSSDEPKETYRLSPLEEEMVKGLEEKASKAGLDVNIRVITTSNSFEKAKRYLDDILNAFGQYNIFEYGNSFKVTTPRDQEQLISFFIHRHFDLRYGIVLNSEELSSLWHLPLPSTETPKIDWLLSRKSVPPSNIPREGLLLGISSYRGHNYEIRMKQEDRRRHMYIIGKSGGGKSVLMKSLIKQDIEEGRGVCVMDPHGDLARECIEFVPKERAEDVIYLNPADYDRPMALNMLEYDESNPQQKTFAVEEMLKIFDQLYDLKATGGPMFEYYMRNAMLLLMDHPESGSTLVEIPKVLADDQYRAFKLSKCKTQSVRDFWIKEAQKAGGEASLANMVPYIASKLTPFITNDFLRPVISQQKSSFSFREAMDSGKLIFCELNKGKLGDMSSYLVGMIVVGKILMAALARGDMDPKDRRDFYLYIDEFQNFLTDSISAILSEARKYGLNLTIAHQFISQLAPKGDTAIRDAIFGNIGTMMSFRVGAEDAEFLEKEFSPVFSKFDMMNTEAFTVNIKLLIDNTASKPFNMMPIMPPPGNKKLAEMIKELSRYKYGRKRELIEAELQDRYTEVDRMVQAEAAASRPRGGFDF